MKNLLILILLILFLNYIEIPNTKTVFNEIDNEYKFYYITTPNTKIEDLKEIKNITIYIDTNPIYIDKVKNVYTINESYTTNKVIKDYYKQLNDIGLLEEVQKLKINGIKVKKIKLYTNYEQITDLLKKYPNFVL